ncbi:MAG: 2'-5' RNA ligase family protein [Candidatus Riflebacteria bacterium]|nr:2'-5' RNA ligase family protein [Candidatus Riflebacteria bacterium]
MNAHKHENSDRSLPYTLAFRVPSCFRGYLASCQQKLTTICNSFEPPENAHLTVKFMGHSSGYLDDEKIVELLPQIHRIASKYLPLKIYLRGFDVFRYEHGRITVVFLKVMPNQRLNAFHHELCENFAEFETFSHADKENYQPHITLSKDLKPDNEKQIMRLVSRSHKMAKRHLKIDDLVVMSPNRLFPVTADQSTSLICPPVK